MSDTKLVELQEIAKKALESQSVSEKAFCLLEALKICSAEAARLKLLDPKIASGSGDVNEDLIVSRRLLNHLMQKMCEGVLFIDLTGTILFANASIHKIWQKKSGHLIQKRFWDVFSDESFGFSMKEALRYGIAHQLLYQSAPDLGKELEFSSSFFYEGDKSSHGLLVLIRDVTQKQKLQELITRGDRMKQLGEMAAKIAHEIRNPLGAIRGFASLLYRDLEGQNHLQDMAAQMIEGTKALEALVTNVLVFAKPLQIQLQTLDLTRFLQQLGKFIKADPAFAPNITLLLNVPHEPVLVPFDPEALKRALLNLRFNGLQAMTPKGGILSIGLIRRDGVCNIAIGDTGSGMDETTVEHLFSPLFTTKRSGNGFGLVESKKVIEAHGGTIEVQTIKGQGAIFTLTLPLKR